MFSVFCITVTLPAIFSSSPRTIKAGIYENEPKIFTAKGDPAGFWVELLNHLALEENWNIVWIHGTWDECLQRLEEGKIDLMPDMAYTEERSQKYVFQDETVFISWARVYVPVGSSIQSFPDLNNQKIAVLKGSVNYKGKGGIKELTEKFGIDCMFIETDSYADVFNLLEEKEADAGVVNKNFGNVKEEEYTVKRTPIVFQPADLRFAFSKKSALITLLKARIDYNIKEMKANRDSIYYSLMEKYFEGSITKKFIIPSWIIKTTFLIAVIAFFLLMVSIVSGFKVKWKTAQLKESEERYRTLFDSSKDAIMTLDPSTLKFTSGNRSILDMFKFRNEKELTSLTPWDVSPKKQPDGRPSSEKGREQIQKAIDVGSNFFEWTHMRRTGELFPATVLLTRVDFSDKATILLATVRDVTECKRTEEALREGEARFRTVIENLPQGVFVHDLEGHIIMVNKTSCKETGYTRKELISMKMPDIDPECPCGKDEKRLWPGLEKDSFKRMNSFLRRKDGSRYPAEIYISTITLNGEPMILAIVQDITERIEREEEYKKLINGMNDTAFVIDFNGNFLEVNDAAVEFLGYSREELLSMGPQDIDSTVSDKGIELLIEEMKTDEKQVLETKHITKTGDKIPVEISSSRVTYKGKPAILSIARDITERKKAEE
ncbi:MAG: PAS domain S-box protein, partial [candidate division WOR-3 bacterium]